MVLPCKLRHLANNFDGYEEEWLPSCFDVVKRVQGAMPHILLYAYRRSEVSLERIHNKCRL